MKLFKGLLIVVVSSCIAVSSAIALGLEVGGNYGMYKWTDSISSSIGWKDGNLYEAKVSIKTSKYLKLVINYNFWKSEYSFSNVQNGDTWDTKGNSEWNSWNLCLEPFFPLKYRITPYIRAGLGLYRSKISTTILINGVETYSNQSKSNWRIGFNYGCGLQVRVYWLIEANIGVSWYTLPETSKYLKSSLRNIYLGLSVVY